MASMHEEIRAKLGPRLLSWEERLPRRVYLSVRKEDILFTGRLFFRDLGMRFSIASGLETPAGFEILYHFSHDKSGVIYTVRILIEDKKNPACDSLATLFPGAEWIEREMWEMLGIVFTGHPNLKRLLLADDWPEGNFPLRNTSEG